MVFTTSLATHIGRSWVAARQRAGIRQVKHARELSTGVARRDIREPRERSKREHEGLRTVRLGHVSVTARDLLALDGAIHGPGNWCNKAPTCASG